MSNHLNKIGYQSRMFDYIKTAGIKTLLTGILCTGLLLSASENASAQSNSSKKRQQQQQTSSIEQSPRYASIVVNSETGAVIFEDNADKPRYPASLTKMMTVYLAFEAIKAGRIKLEDRVEVSSFAASQPALKLGLQAGESISIKKLIESIVVRSANDSAVTLAEAIGGSESRFASIMTKRARDLGMSKTTFRNASGLPDPEQITTASDLAKLGMALRRDFPEYYHLFKTDEFTWKGKSYLSHNRVTRNYPGADGLKTGFVRASGFNLATSVNRDGYKIVAVVMGGATAKARDIHMMSLLDKSLMKLATMDGKDSSKYLSASSGSIRKASPKYSEEEIASNIPENMGGDFPDSQSISANTSPAKIVNQAKIEANWGIQVGAFLNKKDALMAATHASNLAAESLDGSEIKITSEDNRIYRARIANISREQANNACKTITSSDENCFVLKMK